MVSLSRCSCCRQNETLVFAVSDPSPGSENVCPAPALSSVLDVCLQHISNESSDCTDLIQILVKDKDGLSATLSKSVNDHCSCGFSQFYLRGLDVSCKANRMRLSGSAWARTPEQQRLIQNWYHDFLSSHHAFPMYSSMLEVDPECATPLSTLESSNGSFQAWELSLIILASLLVVAGMVAFLLYYIRRRPQNYTTIEMNNHRETSVDY